MKKLKREKGITLIALIITIVVLLILAGVAIGTLQESNIIGQAKDAASKYETEKGKEIDEITGMEAMLDKYAQGINNDNQNENDLEELAKYLLGPNKEGRDLKEIYSEDNGFKPDPNNTNSKIHTKVKLAYTEVESTESESILILYVKYNRAIYKVRCSVKIINQNTIEANTLKDSVVFVESLDGNLGKYVKYANNTWIVLTDDDSGVELISANALGSINFISSTPEEAREEYNKIIKSLVQACEDETGITTNIRSVGSYITEEETLSDSNTVVFRDLKTFSPIVDYSEFAKFEGETGFIKDNVEYETDYNKMKKLVIVEADNGASYWLASRYVYEHNDARSSYINFEVRYIGSYGILLEQTFCTVGENAYSDIAYGCDSEDYRAVRPIVMMDAGTLDNVTQSGEVDDPIILN